MTSATTFAPTAVSLLRDSGRLMVSSLKQARSVHRRYLTRRHRTLSEVLVLWYGSFGLRGGPTLGDLKAVNHVSARLHARGVSHSVVTADFDFEGHARVGSIFEVAPPEKGLVFVCGPLTDWCDLVDYLDVCGSVPKVAVGVSVLPAHRKPLTRFDAIVARDGVPGATFDLAVSAVVPPAPSAQPLRRVALCLRGPQVEYGVASQDARAYQLLRGLAQAEGLEVVEVDTLLTPSADPFRFDAALREVDAVFTTRMHGALLGLAAGKPVLALDQIPGGAKVTAVLRRVGWPLVHDAATVTACQLASAWASLQSGDRHSMVRASQARIAAETAAAMDAAMHAIAPMTHCGS